MFPEPYFSKKAYEKNLNMIQDSGFVVDPFLSQPSLPKTFGLNFTMGWPLPASIQVAYRALSEKLTHLDSHLYVYPYQETHITVATLVDFVNHVDPSAEELTKMNQLSEQVISATKNVFATFKETGSLELTFGPPLLSQKAIFIPILEPSGRIQQLRDQLKDKLKPIKGLELVFPNIIHTTIARFQDIPKNLEMFVRSFEDLSRTTHLGTVAIDEILMTTETKPYMIDGEILHRFSLELG